MQETLALCTRMAEGSKQSLVGNIFFPNKSLEDLSAEDPELSEQSNISNQADIILVIFWLLCSHVLGAVPSASMVSGSH